MSTRKKCLETLVKEIYGGKLINYHEASDPFSEKPCFELVTGVDAKGLIDDLKFTPKYREKIVKMFTFTFNPDERIVVKYNSTKPDFDQLHMIENFCKFVGIDKLKILDKDYDYAYWYTEESPFEVMEHIDEYAPYIKHVVCCSKSNWPEKAEKLQQSKEVPVTVLEFLQQNNCYHKCFGVIISHILNTQFVPLLFDEVPGIKFDDSSLNERFKAMREQSKRYLLLGLITGHIPGMMPGAVPCTIPELVLPTNSNGVKGLIRPFTFPIDIIIVDSKFDKRLEGKPDLDPKKPTSGLYDVTTDVRPSIYLTIPSLHYRTKDLAPDIDMTGIIQLKIRLRIYLKSDSNLKDSDVVAKASTNPESAQVKHELLLSPDLFEQYKAVHNKHYLQTMRCIEQLTELVLSLDLVSLINESANKELIKSFKQCLPIIPAKSCIEYQQQAEDEQPFDASEISFALLQWIGELGQIIEIFSEYLNKIYIGGASWAYLDRHVKNLKEYIYKEELLQAIDIMNQKIEQIGPKEEQPLFSVYDDYVDDYTLSRCWGDWQTYRLNTLEKFRSALESYREKLCDMMTIDEE